MIDVNNLSGYHPPSNEEIKHREEANEKERLKKLREEARDDRAKIAAFRHQTIRLWEESIAEELKSLPQTLKGIVGQDCFHVENAQDEYGWMIERPLGGFAHSDDYLPIFVCENKDVYQSKGYSLSKDKPVCKKVELEAAARYFCLQIVQSLRTKFRPDDELENYPLYIPNNDLMAKLFDRRIEDFISGRDIYSSKDSLYRGLLHKLGQEQGKTNCFSIKEDHWLLGIDPETMTPYKTKSPELVKYLRERFQLDTFWMFRTH